MTTFDEYEAVQEPLPPGFGYWIVRFGDLRHDCRAESPSEARRLFSLRWPEVPRASTKPTRIETRLISGFPEIPGHELVFGETVLKGDCLPEADSPAYRVINCADDLEIYLLDVPSHAVFVPPFRAHTTQKGQWKSPTLDELRRRASKAIEAAIGDDRRKGRGCE